MKQTFILAWILLIQLCSAQKKDLQFAAVGFYNLENLYDTLDDPFKNDDDFTPTGSYAWTGQRYRHKIEQLSRVIAEMGTDHSPWGIALLGVCEVENIGVLLDLCASPRMRSRGYKAVLIEGPDARGVDPGLLYQTRFFELHTARSYPVHLPYDSLHKTRDILVVSGEFLGEPLSVLVNHWPSRRGGELKSRGSRNAAARVARRIADSIATARPGAKILIMGDLNDDPVNDCVKQCIRTYADPKGPIKGAFFNPMEKLYLRGIGTLAYQDSWNLFDQIMLNEPLMKGTFADWQYYDVRINNKPYLRSDYGNFKGYPFRTYSGGTYSGGFSDHFASYIVLAKRP